MKSQKPSKAALRPTVGAVQGRDQDFRVCVEAAGDVEVVGHETFQDIVARGVFVNIGPDARPGGRDVCSRRKESPASREHGDGDGVVGGDFSQEA